MDAELEQGGSNQEIFNSTEVKAYAKEDMDFFAGLALPEVATLKFPAFYTWLWGTIISALHKTKDFSKFAIALPRGHGKTMVMKLIILYAILFTQKRYILVIGANVAKAIAIISDVCDMLDSYNIQQVFGNWRYQRETNTQELKKFSFNGRPVILEAAGQGTSIRGSNQKFSRPDLIVFDDAQTKECAASITEAKSFMSWFVGTAMKSKALSGCTFLYIGNMYQDLELAPGSGVYACMLRNLQKSAEWISIVVGAILENSTALWEELYSLEELLAEYRGDLALGQAEIFYAEVQNDPAAKVSYYFDPTKLLTRVYDGYTHQGNFIIIDPATSKNTPDQVVINYFEIYENIPYSIELIEDSLSSPKTVYKGLELALKHNCGLILVESNAYQYALCEWFDFAMAQMNLQGIHIEPIYSTKGKVGKIKSLLTSMNKQEIGVSTETRSAVVAQATAFDPAKNNNLDDILDTFAMALEAPGKYRHLMLIPGDLSHNTLQNLAGIPDQSTQPPQSAF